MKKIRYVTLFLCIAFSAVAQKELTDTLPTTKKEKPEHGEVRAEFGVKLNGTTDQNQGNAYYEYLVDLSPKKHIFVNGLFGYASPLSLDASVGYVIGKKHFNRELWIAPAGCIVGGWKFIGLGFGYIAKIGNEKIYLLLEQEFIHGFGRQDILLSYSELTYHPIHLIEVGLEPTVRGIMGKYPYESLSHQYQPIEADMGIGIFARFYIKNYFFGLGLSYERKQPDPTKEHLQDVSIVTITLGRIL